MQSISITVTKYSFTVYCYFFNMYMLLQSCVDHERRMSCVTFLTVVLSFPLHPHILCHLIDIYHLSIFYLSIYLFIYLKSIYLLLLSFQIFMVCWCKMLIMLENQLELSFLFYFTYLVSFFSPLESAFTVSRKVQPKNSRFVQQTEKETSFYFVVVMKSATFSKSHIT